MNHIKLFEEFIHSGLLTINEVIDLRDYEFLFNASEKSVKLINKLLKSNQFKLIKLFH